MRPALALAISLVAAACGPKAAPPPPSFDEDLTLGARGSAAPVPAERPVAPPGPGLRTGTIARADLIAVLDAGPAAFLRQLEVTPKLAGERFVGWQLVQLLDPQSPLATVDIAPGDVLLAINGNPLSRPDQLQTVWDSLRTANRLSAELWRGDAQLTLDFAVEPAL